ncbi:MAG: sugar phosphate isomerase/epimerase [Anaerolineae bacterium]|nr:sugar phosphate isomerase/epimerase [Anaerolineae bacterium]
MARSIRLSVFTKPWKMSLPELGAYVRALGFDGIELPVRPGYQVTPDTLDELPRAAVQLREHGIQIESIAGPTDEKTIAACAEAGVPMIRTMVRIGEAGYMASVAQAQRSFEALLPALDRYGVHIGVQNHCDRNVCNAMGLRHLLEPFDPQHLCAVWDAAHNALNGEDPELALDIVWPWLAMVNLKNAVWQRTVGPEAEVAQWRHYWTSGRQGLASWARVARELERRRFAGPVCLTAEYDDRDAVDRLIREDLAYARALFTWVG